MLFTLALLACTKSTAPAAPAQTTAPTIDIVKGPLDEREYRYVKLDNGLQALLIHDPDTDMAAAALDVHVGHYADPPDREGLAHFLEHMLFMGTDEFPEVDAYRKYIQDNGGWSNAGTGGESTGYYFQVKAEHLEGAFDRFSRFFVAPRLDPDYVDRERNAVNSEYSLKVKDHARRIREVRKSTMNQAHPESKFSVGNLDTLADRGDDTVHARLLDLYGAEYRPDRMTVAILGNESLSELERWVRDELSQVKGEPKAEQERPEPFLDEHLGVRIDMAPVDERRYLELQWVLPPEEDLWPQRPHGFVSSMLGHEGEGTLFSTLKGEGWIETLFSGTTDGADDYDLFTVNITLTEQGVEHVDTIIAAVYDQIGRISDEGLEAWRYEEQAKMADLNFRFAEERPVVNTVNAAAWALSWAPPEHVLDHWALYGEFDPTTVRDQTLAHMTVDNMRMLVTLPESESGATLDQKEERYDVAYSMRDLTEAEKSAFTGGSGLEIALPARNPYLPETTELKPGGENPTFPQRVKGGQVELWHLHDTSFGVPRANTSVQVYSEVPREDGLKSITTTYLYNRLINDAIEEFKYPIDEAGLDVRVSANRQGLYINLFGYDDRQDALLADLSLKIRSLTIDPTRFEVEKASLARGWRNHKTSQRPINQAAWAMEETLNPDDPSVDEMLPVLEKLTVADVEALAGRFFDKASAQVLVHGNVTRPEAESLAHTVQTTLLDGTAPLDAYPIERRTLPEGKTLFQNLDIPHDDSTLFVRYQDDATDLDTHARWQMLGALARTPFFTQLRTEQQLGYVVGAYFRNNDQLPTVNFRVQSTVAGPVTLLERVDTFLAEYAKTLEAMPESEFENIRNGLSAQLRESKTLLRQRSQQLERDLDLGVETFDRLVTIADRVDTLNKADMLDLWKDVFLGGDGRVVMRSFGKAHQDEVDGKGCNDEACVAKQLDSWTRDLLGN